MDIQELLNKAWELKKDKKHKEALDLYNKAYDILISEAGEFAHNQEGTYEDFEENGEKVRKITPKLFDKSKEYLRRDKIAATILNNMGVIYSENLDYESAERLFNESIELTPDGLDYPDPKIGLESINKIRN